jgi:hypothetical protein
MSDASPGNRRARPRPRTSIRGAEPLAYHGITPGAAFAHEARQNLPLTTTRSRAARVEHGRHRDFADAKVERLIENRYPRSQRTRARHGFRTRRGPGVERKSCRCRRRDVGSQIPCREAALLIRSGMEGVHVPSPEFASAYCHFTERRHDVRRVPSAACRAARAGTAAVIAAWSRVDNRSIASDRIHSLAVS